MITGVHAVLYSKQAERVQAFLRDVLGLPWVDAGGNWPIFAAPQFEIGVHPTDGEASHELFLVCDDNDTRRRRNRAVPTAPRVPLQLV